MKKRRAQDEIRLGVDEGPDELSSTSVDTHAHAGGPGPQLKCVATEVPTGIVSDARNVPHAIVVNLLESGVASYERIGETIRMDSLRFRFIYEANHSVVAGPAPINYLVHGMLVRTIVLYDKYPAGVIQDFDEVFGCQDAAGVFYNSFAAFLRPDMRHRYRVLRDRIDRFPLIPCPPQDPAWSQALIQRMVVEEYIPLHGLLARYSGASAAQGDQSYGRLMIISISDVNSTGNVCEQEAESAIRLCYYDQ